MLSSLSRCCGGSGWQSLSSPSSGFIRRWLGRKATDQGKKRSLPVEYLQGSMKVKRVDPPGVEKVDAVRQSEKVGVGAVKGATKPTKGKQRKKKAEKVGKDKGKLIITDGVGKKAAAKGSGKGVEKTIEVKRSTSGDYSNGEARWQGLPELRVTDLPEEAQESIRTTLNAVDQQSKNSGRKYKGEISAAQSYTNLVKVGNMRMEVGRFARLSDGAVLVRNGGVAVMTTAVARPNTGSFEEGTNLMTEYKEKAAARGRIPENTRRQEMQTSEKETLIARLIDRGLRPCFMKGFSDEVQLTCTLMSSDMETDSDPISMNAASAVLMYSIPQFNGPAGAVRVAKIKGKYVENPSSEQIRDSTFNLVYAGTKENILAIEAEGAEVSNEEFVKALEFAREKIQPILVAQEKLRDQHSRKGTSIRHMAANFQKPENLFKKEEDLDQIRKGVEATFQEAFQKTRNAAKRSRSKIIGMAFKECYDAAFKKAKSGKDGEVRAFIDSIAKEQFRNLIVKEGIRCDGRTVTALRPLRGEIGVLGGGVHGSAVFERGDTQVMMSTTLGLPTEAQKVDQYLAPQDKLKRFMLHYEFPPYCTGEIGPMGRKSRREIGHGVLAEKSLAWLVPTERDELNADEIFSGRTLASTRSGADPFKYVVRLNADVMSSDGSSSMATACAGSLALMHAGVPIARHVAGISIGLITTEENATPENSILLTDILGIEDHYGDMDFKISGTKLGITAVQLDVKLPKGLPMSLVLPSLERAADARSDIIDMMHSVISEPSKTFAKSAPRMEVIKTEPLMRPVLVKNGGEMLKRITNATNVKFQYDNTGDLHLYAPSHHAMRTAKRLVQELIGQIEVGSEYKGEVVRVQDYGVFVEVLPGRQGLLHISEIVAPEKQIGADIEAELPKVGEKVSVLVTEYDSRRGLIKLKMA